MVNVEVLGRSTSTERSRRRRCTSTGSSHKGRPVKVLARGEIDKALTVKAHAFSGAAKAKIEAAGGTAEVLG